VRRRHELGQDKNDDSVAEPQGGIGEAHQPALRRRKEYRVAFASLKLVNGPRGAVD
jgi:hypothetical protein